MDKVNPDNTGRNQAGQFAPGVSGNPAGRPRGALNHATRAALAMMQGQVEQLTEVVVARALEGDMTAMKLILDRLVPTAKESTVEPGAVTLPELSGASVPDAVAAVVQAVAAGTLPPGQGQALVGMLDNFRKAVELEEIERRLVALEQAAGGEA